MLIFSYKLDKKIEMLAPDKKNVTCNLERRKYILVNGIYYSIPEYSYF